MYGGNPFAFLVDTLFHLYTVALLLRFLMQLVRADFRNPLSQALVKVTNPVLLPLRRLVPGVGGVDVASIIAMLLVKGLGIWLAALVSGVLFPAMSLLVATVYQLLDLVLLTYIFTIIIQVVVSWLNPGAWNPALVILHQLNAPLLGRVRRRLPPMGGLDLSPLFVLIGLQFLRLVLQWMI